LCAIILTPLFQRTWFRSYECYHSIVHMILVGSSTFPVEEPMESFTMAWQLFWAGHGALDGKPEESSQLWPTYSSCCW